MSLPSEDLLRDNHRKEKIDVLKGGGRSMATNFQLFSHRSRDSLHLQLYGDFDGTSAYELINAVKEHENDVIQIFIDTNDLNNIYPFGVDVFQNNLNLTVKNNNSFIFIGKHKRRFAV
jgi:hypothetical protein